MRSKQYNAIILAVCLTILAGCTFFRPERLGFEIFGFRWPVHCLLNHVFEIRCALCGMTRSFSALGHGELSKALEYHVLGPVFFCYILFQIPYRVWALAKLPRIVNKTIRKFHAVFTAAVILAVLINWFIYLGGRLL